MTQQTHRDSRKSHSYAGAASELRRELGHDLDTEALRRLHRRRPGLHFAIVLRQFLLLAGTGWIAFHFANPLVWIPAAILEGFVIFNFTVLLHEQVHDAIFVGKHPGLMRLLGLAYAIPSGISASQFHRWHMDHHENLGSTTEDPKRAHLSPKRNARWYKMLYMTPALIPIYFAAARKENAGYSAELRGRIARERALTILVHLGVFAGLLSLGGWFPVLRAYLAPYLLVFPVAFTLNRLGQHYRIDPADPRKWSTRIDGNPLWHFLFLWSNFHLEHHYFQSVPFYNLPELNRQLRPYFAAHGIENHGYAELLAGWFGQNRAPHTNWDLGRG